MSGISQFDNRYAASTDIDFNEDLKHKFVLRLSEKMRADIHRVANLSRRSMNKEINARLEHSLSFYPSVPTVLKMPEVKHLDSSATPETQWIVNQALKEKLGKLTVEHKTVLLKFLNTFL